jgi:uncharacterized protein YuzE
MKGKLKGETIVFEVQRDGKIAGVDVFYNGIFQHIQMF